MTKTKNTVTQTTVDEKIKKLEQQLQAAKARELRAQADYQNLVRRSQQERTAFVKMAARDSIEALLQPLSHLELASAQIKDPGLTMVIDQFKRVLEQQGLEEIDPIGQLFNVETMEVVETMNETSSDQSKAKVIAVRAKGYRLNGQVIQHAKVVLGS